jgi:hypothetical protein
MRLRRPGLTTRPKIGQWALPARSRAGCRSVPQIIQLCSAAGSFVVPLQRALGGYAHASLRAAATQRYYVNRNQRPEYTFIARLGAEFREYWEQEASSEQVVPAPGFGGGAVGLTAEAVAGSVVLAEEILEIPLGEKPLFEDIGLAASADFTHRFR